MRKLFIVVSGLPGSGKTKLARRLAPVLSLPLIDKDDILERLFESKGVGDALWRRELSRESDQIFQAEALASGGAILVSFWHVAGMPSNSGTSTHWLAQLSAPVVNLHCDCEPEVGAARFLQRKRHPGHLDVEASPEEILASLRRMGHLPPLNIQRRINVDTLQEPALAEVAGKILHALNDDRQR